MSFKIQFSHDIDRSDRVDEEWEFGWSSEDVSETDLDGFRRMFDTKQELGDGQTIKLQAIHWLNIQYANDSNHPLDLHILTPNTWIKRRTEQGQRAELSLIKRIYARTLSNGQFQIWLLVKSAVRVTVSVEDKSHHTWVWNPTTHCQWMNPKDIVKVVKVFDHHTAYREYSPQGNEEKIMLTQQMNPKGKDWMTRINSEDSPSRIQAVKTQNDITHMVEQTAHINQIASDRDKVIARLNQKTEELSKEKKCRIMNLNNVFELEQKMEDQVREINKWKLANKVINVTKRNLQEKVKKLEAEIKALNNSLKRRMNDEDLNDQPASKKRRLQE